MVRPVEIVDEQTPEGVPALKLQLIPVGFSSTNPFPVPDPVALIVTVGPMDRALRVIVWFPEGLFRELSFTIALALIEPTVVAVA
jgi:hypothetical protein